jgi:hypothetical protein
MDTLFLEDRIAFAAIHLADHPLNEYLQGCQRRAVITGILPGLIVSGLNAADACIGILQRFVCNFVSARSPASSPSILNI